MDCDCVEISDLEMMETVNGDQIAMNVYHHHGNGVVLSDQIAIVLQIVALRRSWCLTEYRRLLGLVKK